MLYIPCMIEILYPINHWSFSSSRKHLLVTLLSLEFIVLVLYLSVYYYLCGLNYSLFFVVYFLVFSVCEGSLGLSILVSMIRSHFALTYMKMLNPTYVSALSEPSSGVTLQTYPTLDHISSIPTQNNSSFRQRTTSHTTISS
jgi:NADH-ubiquinone oxidoreductase chain 4L